MYTRLRVGQIFKVDGEKFQLKAQDCETPYDSGLYVKWIGFDRIE